MLSCLYLRARTFGSASYTSRLLESVLEWVRWAEGHRWPASAERIKVFKGRWERHGVLVDGHGAVHTQVHPIFVWKRFLSSARNVMHHLACPLQRSSSWQLAHKALVRPISFSSCSRSFCCASRSRFCASSRSCAPMKPITWPRVIAKSVR